MRAFRVATVLLALVGGCQGAKGPTALGAGVGAVRVGDCEGPARSLPPALAATLPPRDGAVTIDDIWAEFARELPGGFAGVLYDTDDGGRPVLMLARPDEAAAATAALAPHLPGFPVASATVRRARWDFAQLVNWYTYLMRQPAVWEAGGLAMGDKDEVANRIELGVVDEAARARLTRALEGLDLPCDLVLVEVTGPLRY